MLLLSVREGDYVMIGDEIKVKIVNGSGISKLGVEAPKSLPILRQAIYERVNDIEPDREPENIVDL